MSSAIDESESMVKEGFVVANKYRLIASVGVGSMGSVWRAVHMELGSHVAIKFLFATHCTSSEARTRFEREAKLAARLGEGSRHITRVMDYGFIANSVPFIVMELLEGEVLSDRLKRESTLPFETMVQIITQLCRALHVAHDAQVVHRDLKPANIFLCKSEQEGDQVFVKLLDFGVAKAMAEGEDVATTRAGTLIGTPLYMSPEQIVSGHKVDIRADLWAVAAIAYRLVVGYPPFGAGQLDELSMRIVSVDPVPPSNLVQGLPSSFDLWIRKGLAKKAHDRFQTVKELVESLQHALAESTGAFRALAPRVSLIPGGVAGTMQWNSEDTSNVIATATIDKKSAGRPFKIFGVAAGIALVLGALGFFLLNRGTPMQPSNVRASQAAAAIAVAMEAKYTERVKKETVFVQVPVVVSTQPSTEPPPAKVLTIVAPKTNGKSDQVRDINKEAAKLWGKKDEL